MVKINDLGELLIESLERWVNFDCHL